MINDEVEGFAPTKKGESVGTTFKLEQLFPNYPN
jgi:hypothetical protein